MEEKPKPHVQKEAPVVVNKEVKKTVEKEKTVPVVKKEKPQEVKLTEKIQKQETQTIQTTQAFMQEPQTEVHEATTQTQVLQEKPQEEIKKEIQKEVLPPRQASVSDAYMNEHMQQLVKLLQENLYYPRSARKRGIQGRVVVKFTLQQDATVSYIEVVSSKNEILSRAAVLTIENLSGKFPKPKEKLTLHVPIQYDLKN